jgi:hypothetical protein
LWLTRATKLDDKWEVMLLGQQLNKLINSRPGDETAEEATSRISKRINEIRNNTYVNCWTNTDNESHALWNIYCPSTEGVAIKTTVEKLKQSISPLKLSYDIDILKVSYNSDVSEITDLDVSRIVAQKRPMFSYENELRIALVGVFPNSQNPNRERIGLEIDWDPEIFIDKIYVHPDAQAWYMDTVTETVKDLAPQLIDREELIVCWSKMTSSPPL